eukprot:GEMP01052228.1.p1 GENE.GEMP01052228.1~~GEMP01052228.1.p1  ORF type:complete len:239 (+),score=58.66 GEMP01052228.1:295-1011(+)
MGSPRGNTRKYGKLWGGRDATYSLALGSLNAEDSHVLNFTLKDLEYKHQRSLRLYEKHFHGKYPVVGRLTEYTNQTADLPSLEELPAKNEPRPSPPTMQRRIKKLTAVEADKVCHAAGFEDLEEDCRVGDLSSAMCDMGREKLKEIAARVDVPFRELPKWDDEILSIEIVERALEFSGRRNLNPGVEVVLRGLAHAAYNDTMGTVEKYVQERERYAVKLKDSAHPATKLFKAENLAVY